MDIIKLERIKYINNNLKWLNINNKYEILYILKKYNESVDFRKDKIVVDMDLISEKCLIDIHMLVYNRYQFLDSRY